MVLICIAVLHQLDALRLGFLELAVLKFAVDSHF